MELELSLQDDSRALQYEQGAAKQKMLTMEMDTRALNTKIHSMSEQAELNSDLQAFIAFIAGWLASELHLEEEIAHCLTRARHIGPLHNPKQQVYVI